MTDRYFLHDLPFTYDALEPWCSAATLELHHGKHHAAYVQGANDAVEALETVDPHDAYTFAGMQTALTFNVAGNALHSLFWQSLSPSVEAPGETLRSQIAADFGSVERVEDLLRAECMGVQGSGWGAIVFDPTTQRLQVGKLHDHQHSLIPNALLLAVVDVWEHAYYLGYQNNRAGWVQAVVQHLDWTSIGQRFDIARAAQTLTV